MSRSFLIAAVSLLCMASSTFAVYSVGVVGQWPDSWPKELESLRKQAKTYVGPMIDSRHYLIPFKTREEFESAWPHLLAVKSKGSPIILIRGTKSDFFKVEPAGVIVHTPPVKDGKELAPTGPVPGQRNPRSTWMNTNYIELVVDGNIVDLNRIPLPPDTPIIDERFKSVEKPIVEKRAEQGGALTKPEPSGAPPASSR